jgi:site-specific recombinase XerD
MINHCYQHEIAKLRPVHSGPLGPHLDGFAIWLGAHGYSPSTATRKIRLVGWWSRWLEEREIGLAQLHEQRIGDFLKRRSWRVGWRNQVRYTRAQLLQHLRPAKLAPVGPPPASECRMNPLMREYERFLDQERGFSQASLRSYRPVARHFLSEVFGGGTLRLRKLGAAQISQFVLRATDTLSPKRVQLTTSVLRSFLGFLYQRGQLGAPLAGAVPTVAAGRGAEPPRFLEPAQVQQLLESCDRRSRNGRRDYAVLLLLARLGLRAGEVAGLNLEDLDWHSGEVLIHGKSAREDRLPLPPDGGRALAAYLRKGRPPCSSRRVFIRTQAPRTAFSNSGSISKIVGRARRRARLTPAHKGAHLLRHTLATRRLQGGASLTQIGEVLRHQHAQTTEVYAKVNFTALRAIAQPWPGGAR